MIIGEQDPPGSGGGILLTDQKFGDFELPIDMKFDWGVCSGLFLRNNDKGQCFQMMVNYHDADNVGHLYGESTLVLTLVSSTSTASMLTTKDHRHYNSESHNRR